MNGCVVSSLNFEIPPTKQIIRLQSPDPTPLSTQEPSPAPTQITIITPTTTQNVIMVILDEDDIIDEAVQLAQPTQIKPGGRFIIGDRSSIVKMDESPSGFGVRLLGSVPNPCNEPYVTIHEPDFDGYIAIDVKSKDKTRPGFHCQLVVKRFMMIIPLNIFDPEQHVLIIVGKPPILEIY